MKRKGQMSMTSRNKYIYIVITIAILLGIGVWSILIGKIAFGASLMGAALGVGIMRYIKERRMAKSRAKGLDPHDERTMYIAGLASSLTMNVTIFLLAIIILAGSVAGTPITVNPYDLLGYCLAGIVLIYIAAFYYYNRRN